MNELRPPPLLDVREVSVVFRRAVGATPVRAVDCVSVSVPSGGLVGLMGESGSGKTALCHAILRVLPPEGTIESGAILWEGRDITHAAETSLRSIRGRGLAAVFQDATASLNPVRTIGAQLTSVLRLHRPIDRHRAPGIGIELLNAVRMPDPVRVWGSYPSQCSTGMCQRAALALALACEPKLLIADEPTSALDVATQLDVLDLLGQIRRDRETAILMVSHDVRALMTTCEHVLVMQQGRIVESGTPTALRVAPKHPYTRLLLRAAGLDP